MSPRLIAAAALLFTLQLFSAPFSTNGNRLVYLDSDDPFYPGLHFPKLITPQWIGEDGVDAVVVLAIDDMRSNEPKYEAMLRPILDRLKKIDGRAPVSIMVNTSSPTNELVQKWLKEGVSLECHTIAHPCPLCQKGDFAGAAATYHDCVDLLNTIPGNKPVAFRMPCCDSMNSPTPRFYVEIFNRTSTKGNFLTIDSSVMVILTTDDTSLPRELVVDEQGRERFRKYLPGETNATTRVSMGSFTTTIEDYPYPYVINKTCWEFPCIVPSDWEAHNLHGSTNTATVRDWKRALDAIVLKQGVMTFIFHPHGWIRAEQMVEFVDYAASKYGKRVKFLNFREAQSRLNRNLLDDKSLRADASNLDFQLADIDNDGLIDVAQLVGDALQIRTGAGRTNLITKLNGKTTNCFWRLGVFENSGEVSCVIRDAGVRSCLKIDRRGVAERQPNFFDGLPPGLMLAGDPAVLFRDLDRDGACEIIEGRPEFSVIYKRGTNGWRKLAYALPPDTSVVDEQDRDAGLRFVDVDGDGYDDVLFSNHERYSLHLFRPDDRKLRLKPGWTDEIVSAVRATNSVGGTSYASPTLNSNGDSRSSSLHDPIPPIIRGGTNRNNGVWFARDTMWIQNEDTAHLPDKVDRRTFRQLLSSAQPQPKSPEESLKAMRVRPGFKVELVASEPLIESPVAFEWSADGKLWVVEMGDYPTGLDGKGKPGGRVRVLEDTNSDGIYEHATTFLDGLSFPNGIYPWRDGVVISAAPDIFYAADTNGDGKADVREVLFSGFTPGNQQHRVNGFDYGLDGWLYAANGDSGGNVRAERRSPTRPGGITERAGSEIGASVSLRGHDLRIQPDQWLVETIEGQTQFGRHRDDFGNWFGNNNPTWLWHYFFPERYLARNPLLALKTTKKLLANYAESTRCFPASRLLSRFNDAFAAGHVTSGCSATPYRDELFGPNFATSVFICEPVHNLVHREVLETDGVTFTSHRATDETNSEFLTSSDNCFRPVFARTGPDGALYIADMYRAVIEHPEWIPVEMQKRLDLRLGSDKGRIYRVYPEGVKLRKIPNLAKLSTDELVRNIPSDGEIAHRGLASRNGWERDTVQRLLGERRGFDPAELGRALRQENAKARVQALWTWDAHGGVPLSVLSECLRDDAPQVREACVRLSERVLRLQRFDTVHVVLPGDSVSRIANVHGVSVSALLATNKVDPKRLRIGERLIVPGLAARFMASLLSLTNDSNVRVRFQLAFTLGEWNDPRAASALAALLRDADENVRNAALSSTPRHARTVLAAIESSASDERTRAAVPLLRKLVANPPKLVTTTPLVERTNWMSAAHRAERAAVVARYEEVAHLKGDVTKGASLFKQHCAQCHRARGEGAEVGPDLGIMKGKTVSQLVEAVLDPNVAIDPRYETYTAVMKDDEEVSGVIISETPTSITLRAPNRADITVLRAELRELSTSRQSLMPENFEAAFTPQQLADLAAFVLGR